MPILDDGHAFDRAFAFHPDTANIVAAGRAAQLAQAVEIGKSGHGAVLPFDGPAKKGEALHVDVSQGPQVRLRHTLRNLVAFRRQEWVVYTEAPNGNKGVKA